MKKKFWLITQALFLVFFVIFLSLTALRFLGSSNPLLKFDYKKPVYNNYEAYDPSLIRLNSLQKLEQYCDSLYAASVPTKDTASFETAYVDIVSDVVRNRFYHGYSYFSFGNNYVALLASKVTVSGYGVPVMPDDVLQYPNAACSQQAVVMMEVLKAKGIPSRKISFHGKKYGGHFAFEVYYDGAWHFHDPNLEPDKTVLISYGRPGIDFLVKHPDILFKAYNHRTPEELMDIFPTYAYGPVNKFPAPRAAVFQSFTNFLSYTFWLFFLAGFIIARRKYLRIAAANSKEAVISMYKANKDHESVYYPGYATGRN